jgi:hypothetical protein
VEQDAVTDIVTEYISLFRGRGDCYGTWEGGCNREPLTRKHFEQHLAEGPYIGVYPLITDKVSWGCIDIDGKDHAKPCPCCIEIDEYGYCGECREGSLWDWDHMFDIADKLRDVLAVKSIYAHLERTANGIHVWVFPTEPLVAAATMRRALKMACKVIGYNPKEVNPKQEKLAVTQVGNYVRLPYWGAGDGGVPANRYFVDGNRVPLTLRQFLDTARRTEVTDLEAVASLWVEPVLNTTVNTEAGMEVRNLIAQVDGLAFSIWRDGPLPGSDRSTTLARLAHVLAQQGITATAAFQIVKSADERWGKFAGRADCDEQILKFIERAYSQ